MTEPIHHIQKRKRIHKAHDPYPHPHRIKRFVDPAVYFFGVLGPFMGGLQAYKIFHEKTAAGVSSSMFGFMIISNLVWLTYGFIHKERPIITMYILWFFVNTTIVIGTLMYR
jgi:uncharacterized protein with PQ loop repeat